MEVGLLGLRVGTGLLIAGHGVQKVSHRLGGHGLDGGAEEFRGDGFRGGRATAVAAGGAQIGSGMLLALGALTPMAAMTAIGAMTVAVTVKWHNGLWVQNDGYEYPLVLSTIAAAFAIDGPGECSIDAAAGLAPWPRALGAAAALAGVGSGLVARGVLKTRGGRPAISRPVAL